MCESVRTMNTLHEVGARKSSICYNAVGGRKDEKEEKQENEKNDKMRKCENTIFLIKCYFRNIK